MNQVTFNLGGDAAAVVAMLTHQTGWSAEELMGTLLHAALDLQDQGVLADAEGLADPMSGILANTTGLMREGDMVVDPEGNPAKVLDMYRADGNVVALVTTTGETSAVTTKVDSNTYVWRVADLARAPLTAT